MIDRLTLPILTILMTLAVWPGGPALAQSEGGLKLGQVEEPTEKLDLGAAPAVPAPDKEAPPAERPTTVKPATSATLPPTDGAAAGNRSTHGSWEVACDAKGTNCAMAQIGKDTSGVPVLEMVIRKLGEPLEVGERTAIAVLDVITPLGVVLTEELAVTIDNGRRETAPFQICTEQGCLVREPIDGDLVNRLKRGNAVVVAVVAANQGEVKSSLSLSGFTKAFNSLK